ncbi:hypothetical protein [Isoptericola variabilis]|uniref:Uncharacterized protein n=1 Tax=Isoptericola variabilis (strain 225) TaxID=743718 RepID=F6FX53_ISOV2|nr:hypothetical protein [Isoptericola variabilis]AEG44653.1 hypothetical protein Isova_1916 [Isoptericola variabilis 225]TWH28107.1 hypothetical protein L600_004700000070 [Isoptericola variabilis J7]
MALLPRLRALIRRPFSASTVGARRPTVGRRRGDTVQEDALRAMLIDDPNDERAFHALAEIVRRRAQESPNPEDPLSAPSDEIEKQRAADLAVWSLAEELAAHPRGWRPLLELGRLSLGDDPEGAVRRLATAAERDPEGRALAEGLTILRDAGMPVEALGLGVGHWRAREHTPEVGRQLVLAALEADRAFEARQHLESLSLHPDQAAVAPVRAELERAIADAEQASPK